MKRTVLTGTLVSTIIYALTATPSWAGLIQHPDAVTPKDEIAGVSFTQLAQSFLGQDKEYDEENACREELEKADEARHQHDARFPHPKDRALALAGRLAAEETIVGIRSEQLDAWRNYSSALLAFADGPHPHFRDEASPGNEGDDPAKPRENEPLTMDRMADMAIERGEKAQTLKQAAKALLDILTPEQRIKFADAGRKGPWVPHRRMPGAE
ncbi:Spy/CpxP family protein refolding chaperone [Phyllobacterium myrsinacearum]|uniref:Uncharacterized protein n=1 Tax=Phyllobacterium myrsinacearum TaxID=28101 RepID=A0A839EIF2_9HYPH|nr:Spy/CpxP family protein refolding chaperone [Phyllobacterium myrsinacearum]MBA8880103.1 hypothetical protein [Phyllobacterium myrsinacearum]